MVQFLSHSKSKSKSSKKKKKAKKKSKASKAQSRSAHAGPLRKRTKTEWRAVVDELQRLLQAERQETQRQRSLRKAHESDGHFTLEPILSDGSPVDVGTTTPVVLRGELDQVLFVQVPEGTSSSDIKGTLAAFRAMGINRPIAVMHEGFDLFQVSAVTPVGSPPSSAVDSEESSA